MVSEHSQNGLDGKICLECDRQFTGTLTACPDDGTPLIAVVKDPLVGTTLSRKYEILELLGQGGMGVVYKARHSWTDRIVAIKMLKAALITDSLSVKRLQQESKAAGRINHPNVISVLDFGISPNNQPYIVMDFLEGRPLSAVIKMEGQLGVERTIKILKQACDGLSHAHREGVIHRDLKPSNIVLIEFNGEKDFVKVVDFGVAKITGSSESQKITQIGEVCGSPIYMSPEQCRGEDLDARSDIYSMGCVIYESLTGELPILGSSVIETMSKHVTDRPKPFNEARPDLYIPERLEQVVLRALSKNREDRHQSMEELAQDLDCAVPRPGRSQVLRSVPLTQQPSMKTALAKTRAFRLASGIALAAVCFLCIIGWAVRMNPFFGRTQRVANYPVAPAVQDTLPTTAVVHEQAVISGLHPNANAQADHTLPIATPASIRHSATPQPTTSKTQPISSADPNTKLNPRLVLHSQDSGRYPHLHRASQTTETSSHRRAYSTGYYKSPHPESARQSEAERWKNLQALKNHY